MSLQLRHCLAASLDDTLAALASAEYARLLAARHPFFAEVEVLSLRVTPSVVERRLRYRARPFIARLGPFSPAPDWFVWTEHSRLDRKLATLVFENVPVLESVRRTFACSGSMRFFAAPEGAGTIRDSCFDLAFHVPTIYRPLSELALALVRRQLAHTLDTEARLLARWVNPGAASNGALLPAA